MLLISRSQLPSDAKEGDVILYTDGVYQVDKEATLGTEKKIEEKSAGNYSAEFYLAVYLNRSLSI